MRDIKHELSKDFKTLKIHTFADLHLGSPECDTEMIKDRIKEVEKEDNCYCVLNGDIFDNATKTSVSDVYSQTLSPMQQLELGSKLFKPIGNKVLAITDGNHEARTYKNDGLDLSGIFANEIGASEVYQSEGAMIYLKLGQDRRRKSRGSSVNYSIYVTHGRGGGKRAGAKANRLEDMERIVDADIYIHSHTHLPFAMKQAFYRSDMRNQTSTLVDKLFVNTAASMDYGGYGQVAEYRPSSKQNPVIYLDGTKRDMAARV